MNLDGIERVVTHFFLGVSWKEIALHRDLLSKRQRAKAGVQRNTNL